MISMIDEATRARRREVAARLIEALDRLAESRIAATDATPAPPPADPARLLPR